MPQRFNFDPSVVQSVVGGQSAVDMPSLNLQSMAEADAFLKGYGFDAEKAEDLERLWYFHRRALVLMQEKLGFLEAEIPEILRDRKQLKDPRNILIYASHRDPGQKDLQRWSCAVLRCMHIFVHAESDLFSSFSEEIQKQILAPFQSAIYHDGLTGTTYLKGTEGNAHETEPLALKRFESKPFKTSSSTVIKLLAKPDALAMSVFDKIGVRFVTGSMFDTFRVVRFLVEGNLISFPHIMPDQSTNTLYPVNLFLQACIELSPKANVLSEAEINQFFIEYLEKNKAHADFLRKENSFSGADYRFIKFIARKLIRIEAPGKEKKAFSFFYPYEVQIMDEESHHRILSGPSEHHAYKERQRAGARKRLFPDLQ